MEWKESKSKWKQSKSKQNQMDNVNGLLDITKDSTELTCDFKNYFERNVKLMDSSDISNDSGVGKIIRNLTIQY